LTRKEILTLRYLLANEGQVLSRQQILGFAWGYDYDGTPRTVDNTVANLRRKLAGSDESASFINSHPGLGYSLTMPANSGDK
jgi:DNA-binding response OmpR family regulator